MLNVSAAVSPSDTIPTPPSSSQFLADVLEGLSQPTKTLSPKYFYDTEGSIFFDQICELPEYYPYKTELKLLPAVAQELQSILPSCNAVIEFGAGSLKKVKCLLDQMQNITGFIPIDIAEDFLRHQTNLLRKQYPSLQVHPVFGDFCSPLKLPSIEQKNLIGFFPGSTIGNFIPEDAVGFLKNAAATLGKNAHLLIGVDTKKSPKVLHDAYNDSQDITAKFNLNILERINKELNGNFDIHGFEHYAYYNAVKGCVEMHLISKHNQSVTIAEEEVRFTRGESIHTESSYKYNTEEFSELAKLSGWDTKKVWLSDDKFFSLFLLSTDA